MSREDVQKLLGGYATGTLTPEEQQALFAAALDDQELFDALAREQSLRDLLRDPAAKAEVLAALDTEHVPWYRHGWWRPAAVAVAMAGIGVLAVVVVTNKQAAKQETVTVAELKPQAEAPAPAPKVEQAAPRQEQPGVPALRRAKPQTAPAAKAEKSLDAVEEALKKDAPAPPVPAATPPVAQEPAVALSGKKEAAPPPQAAPRFSAASNQAVEAQQAAPAPLMPQAQQALQGQQAGQLGLRDTASGGPGGLGGYFPQDARRLFYGNPVAAEADIQRKAKKAANSIAASTRLAAVPAFRLGVKWSILRKQANGETVEAAPETVLDAGEQVKLKLVPNDRGYLKVWERSSNGAQRLVASGAAAPLQPFEAPAPTGARELYVQFTRDSRAGLPLPETRGSLIQTADVEEKATYVVNRVSDGPAQELVVPITLKYR